jgi:3-oxoacyl-[acyl-carrier protein] reductase
MGAPNALVVGASRGIGRATALRLARDGMDITGTCRQAVEEIEEVGREIRGLGRSFDRLVFDVSDRTATREALAGRYGDSAPDALIFNAGISRDNLFVFMSPDEWDKVLHTNVDGFFNTVQPLLFGMIARKSGCIVVMSSASGQIGQPGQVNYSASKAALIGAVRALSREVGRKGIRVNAVAPGFIQTEMTRDLPLDKVLPIIPLNRAGLAEEVAAVVSFLCGADSTYVHGQVIGVNGGLVV